MSITDTIKKNRPNLSPSSIKTYFSILKNLYNRVYPDDEEIDISKFGNHKKILTFLKDMDGKNRKTILSALVVICEDNEPYKEVMMSDGRKYNEEQKKQLKTEKQEDTWIEQDEIKTIFDKLYKDSKKLYKLGNDMSMSDFQDIQNFIIACLVSGIYIPPRRSLDWTEMKVRNINKDSDNHMDKNKFIFNKYKTSKFYGKQEVNIPPELKRIIAKFLTINDTDYLLVDSKKQPLSPVKLNQRLNKIFGGKVSVNILRHSYLTDKYKDVPSLLDMEQTAENMGHSVKEALEYVKKSGDYKKGDSEK
jgi:hypothetical protein